MSQQMEEPTAPENVEPERIKHLRQSKVKLTQIQEELEKLIDAMTQNPSILSRVSNFWGKVPLWQKIVAGIALIAPPLVLGIVLHAIVCFVITGFALAYYVGSSIVLDDHYNNSQYSTKNIKSGIINLAEGLNVIMESLEHISQALAEQVDIFTQENVRFSDNVTTLKTRNEELTQKIEKLTQTEKNLRLTQSELEATCTALKTSAEEQTALLEETQGNLKKVRIEYEQNQKKLEENTKELEEINAGLKVEVNQYKKTQQTLKATVEVLTENVTLDKAQKTAFWAKLNDFIKNNDITLFEMSASFQAEVNKVNASQQELQRLISEYQTLIEINQEQVSRLEHASLLKRHGFYPTPNDQEALGTSVATPTLQ